MNRPIFLISLRSMKSSGRKSRISPAIWQVKSDASKAVIREMPFRPLRIASQQHSVPTPTDDSRPTPVITTLRDKMGPPRKGT